MPSPSIHAYQGSYLMPSLEHATVANAMHPGILSCEPNATLADVARMMANHHVHCVAVMAGSPDERGDQALVWGIVSDLDLLRAGMEAGEEERADAIAKQPVVSVEPDMPLQQAAALMLANGASHLVVVDRGAGRPIGILSTLDFAGILAWGRA